MDRPLHPNLARIAASYDEIVSAFQQGRLSPADARRQLVALVARDDAGIEWSIDPDSGRWRYRTRWGGLEEADPPSYGMAAATPADLGAGNGRDLDARLSLHEVDMELVTPPSSLVGSTLLRDGSGSRSPISSRQVLGVALALAVLALVVFLMR